MNQVFDGTNQVYEVQLDMSAFYDSISRDYLLTELRDLVDSYYNLSNDETESFWNVVKKSFNWQWHENDFALNDCLKVNLKNDGLPQGLVASGFFANVYLIAFDKACKSLIGSRVLDVSINDYCRYVDDLRFIISVDENKEISEDEINKQLVEMLQALLPHGTKLNPDKTKIIKWNGEEGETVRQMEGIQSLASGPIDMDSIEFAESSLDNLFTRAESSLISADTSQHPLANVHQIKLEVREDTLLRFAANRWAKLFKSRRKLTNQKDLKILDAAQESVARRFVAAWSRNPALTLLLKKGIQLFPEKSLLETIWCSLLKQLDDKTPVREKNIAYYCLSEICRFSATDLKKVLPQDLPYLLNINDYFDWLEKATRVLLENQALPWYLKQQAALVLIGKGPSPMIEGELLLSNTLKIANGELVIGNSCEILPATVVSWQMTKSENVITSLTNWLVGIERKSQYDALMLVALNDPDLFNKLFTIQNQEIVQTVKLVSTTLGLNFAPMAPDLIRWPEKIQLASIIKSTANPFIHENALIKLAIAAIKEVEQNPNNKLTPQRIFIECNDWLNIQNPEKGTIKISVSDINSDADIDPRYQLPSWLNNKNDSAIKSEDYQKLKKTKPAGFKRTGFS